MNLIDYKSLSVYSGAWQFLVTKFPFISKTTIQIYKDKCKILQSRKFVTKIKIVVLMIIETHIFLSISQLKAP